MAKQKQKQVFLADMKDKDTQLLVDLYHKGDYVGMESLARRVLGRKPGHGYAKRALPSALVGQQRYSEARPLLDSLVVHNPLDWEMWTNLGDTRHALGDIDGAIEALERVLMIKPDHALTLTVLAKIYRNVKEPQRALELYYAALQVEPSNRDYFLAWIETLLDLRQYELVVDCLRQSWEEDKNDPEMAVRMIKPARNICDWKMMREGEAKFFEGLQNESRGIVPLDTVGTVGLSRLDQKKIIARRAHALIAEDYYLKQDRVFADKSADQPLRIGYLSGDVYKHATLLLIVGVFERHAEAGLEIYLYSNGPQDDSELRSRALAACTVFRDVRRMTPEQVALQMVDDQLDILVDLKGWTLDYDPRVMAKHPAPITVAWLGFPGTVGHPGLADYIIGDPIVTPLEHADAYSETLALMPSSYQPNDDRRPIGEPRTRAQEGLPENAFVFCSFARTDKYNPETFAVWCSLLNGTPGSVLWLWGQNQTAKKNIVEAAKAHGIEEERLIFSPSYGPEQHLARLSLADLGLDSFPYTSHTTGSDLLWAGVPLLALQGDTFASRVSASLVTAAGMPELVVRSYEEYLSLGLALSNGDRSRLKNLTQRLRENKTQLPLFDTARFTHNLAQLYRRMWDDFLHGKRSPIVLVEN